MANGTAMPPLSPAGSALGLGDLLRGQTEEEAERLRRLRQQQLGGGYVPAGGASRAALASPAGSILGRFGLR
jgi:hypothetical protein